MAVLVVRFIWLQWEAFEKSRAFPFDENLAVRKGKRGEDVFELLKYSCVETVRHGKSYLFILPMNGMRRNDDQPGN